MLFEPGYGFGFSVDLDPVIVADEISFRGDVRPLLNKLGVFFVYGPLCIHLFEETGGGILEKSIVPLGIQRG
jgi:hypothetical protein